MNKLATIILAAGKGTRMKSELPKVLHQVCGKSMVEHIMLTAKDLNPTYNVVVIGHKGEMIKSELEHLTEDIDFKYQDQQLGTGHAVMQAEDLLSGFTASVLVLCGDTPLLTFETLKNLVKKQQESGVVATVLTTKVDDPEGYGRIVRGKAGDIVKIIEEKDATQSEKKIREINTGTYCFDSQSLFSALEEIDNKNSQGEYYLTDIIEILKEENKKVSAVLADNEQETLGVNTRRHLAQAEKVLRRRISNRHFDAGVTIMDPENTYIDEEVEIAKDTIIYPFTMLEGRTKIGSHSVIGPQSRIVDSVLGCRVKVQNSVVLEADIGDKTTVGPFAYLRPGTEIGEDAKVGDFVEIKKSKVGDQSKIPHLSYIGDAIIGQEVNIGAGTITANYDGQKKHKTKIQDGAFIGSDSTLVAPLQIGKMAVTGAGSVVVDDVEDNDLVLGVPAVKKEDIGETE
jgi:bifunctional UDP-N-acetylglucosamine pyrophosphorylase/glucosamine-1-phosphate N-acetyltransferase